jgi:hypothetical protein
MLSKKKPIQTLWDEEEEDAAVKATRTAKFAGLFGLNKPKSDVKLNKPKSDDKNRDEDQENEKEKELERDSLAKDYKQLYEFECSKRFELEMKIAELTAEVEKLQNEVKILKKKDMKEFTLYSDNEDDVQDDGEDVYEAPSSGIRRAAAMPVLPPPAPGMPMPVPVPPPAAAAPAVSKEWQLLAEQERERKEKARRRVVGRGGVPKRSGASSVPASHPSIPCSCSQSPGGHFLRAL